jgi:hypothetical protein
MSSVTKQLNMNITSTRTEVRPTKLAEKTLLLPKRPLHNEKISEMVARLHSHDLGDGWPG